MKTKIINLEGDYVDFKRDYLGGRPRLVAEVGCQTPKGNITKVKIKLDFDCLQYIMGGLKSAWQTEKQSRQSNIAAVDRALGI